MVDPDIVRRKSQQVLHHIERLRSRSESGIAGEQLARDEDLWNVVLMDLQQAIQGCIDLAVHACIDEALGVPEGPAGAFALLARAGWIPEDLGVRLAGAAGLRNLIVHRYGDLDEGIVAKVVAHDLGDLERFLASFQGR